MSNKSKDPLEQALIDAGINKTEEPATASKDKQPEVTKDSLEDILSILGPNLEGRECTILPTLVYCADGLVPDRKGEYIVILSDPEGNLSLHLGVTIWNFKETRNMWSLYNPSVKAEVFPIAYVEWNNEMLFDIVRYRMHNEWAEFAEDK